MCQMAAQVLRGHADHDDHEDHSTPARERQEPVKRGMAELVGMFRVVASWQPEMAVPRPLSAYRSFITLGAVRCDQDVGLHVLVETFLI